MAKFNKLKTYNIMIFALVPLLIIAMVATVTLAAMTDSKEGKNSITIANLGTLSASVTVDATVPSIYPGATNVDIPVTFSYSGANGIGSVAVDVSSFNITSIVATSNSNKTYKISNPSLYLNYTTSPTDVSPKLLDSSKQGTDITINAPTTATPTSANAYIRISFNDGVDNTDSQLNPDNHLTYSIKSIQINFTVNVTFNEPTT